MSKIFTIYDESQYFEGLAFSSKEKAKEYVNKAIEDDPESFTDWDDNLSTFDDLDRTGFLSIDEFELDPEFKSQLA